TDLIKDERQRHQQYVSPLLQINGFPGVADSVLAGAGSRGALFNSVAENFNESLFGIIENSPQLAATVVHEVRGLTDAWTVDAPQRNSTVAEVRRSVLADGR